MLYDDKGHQQDFQRGCKIVANLTDRTIALFSPDGSRLKWEPNDDKMLVRGLTGHLVVAIVTIIAATHGLGFRKEKVMGENCLAYVFV